MRTLESRVEAIFFDIFKRFVFPKIKEVIRRWGQEGLDKAVHENISILDLLRRKDPTTYNLFESFRTKLRPFRRFMYKWDNNWNARFLIKALEKDGIYFTSRATKWLIRQLEDIKSIVYGNNDPRNKQWLYDRYVRKIIPDDLDEFLKKL